MLMLTQCLLEFMRCLRIVSTKIKKIKKLKLIQLFCLVSALAMILHWTNPLLPQKLQYCFIKEEKNASTLNVCFWKEMQWIIQCFSRTAVTECPDGVTCMQNLPEYLGIWLMPGNNTVIALYQTCSCFEQFSRDCNLRCFLQNPCYLLKGKGEGPPSKCTHSPQVPVVKMHLEAGPSRNPCPKLLLRLLLHQNWVLMWFCWREFDNCMGTKQIM